MANGIRLGMDEVLVHFWELEDPQSEVNLRHPLESAVAIALMPVLAGARGCERVRAGASGCERADLDRQVGFN